MANSAWRYSYMSAGVSALFRVCVFENSMEAIFSRKAFSSSLYQEKRLNKRINNPKK